MNREWWKKQYPVLLLCMAVLGTFFANLHNTPLFDLDEGAFSEATREMVERSDFASTYLNGVPRYDKPILIYWLQALSVSVFGVNEWAFRFPSAVCASLWMAVVFLFTHRLFGRREALAATCFAATSLGVIIIGRSATADALLNLCIAASLCNLYRYFQDDTPKNLLYASCFSALGFLTKGPIALIIPGLTTLIYALCTSRFRRWLGMLAQPKPVLLFCGVALPWYIWMFVKKGDEFIHGFLLGHNVNRYLSTMEQHGGQFWYYIPVVFLLVLPYTALLFPAFGSLKKIRGDSFALYGWIWFFSVFLFFSFSKTKLPHYLLYGCTPLFILMARYGIRIRFPAVTMIPVLSLLGAMAALPFLIRYAIPHITDDYLKAVLSFSISSFTAWYFAALGASAVVLTGVLFIRNISPLKKMVCAGVVQTVLLLFLFWPLAGAIMQAPVKEAALFARERNLQVVSWGMLNPSFSVYRGAVTPSRDPRVNDVVFTTSNRLDQLQVPYELYFNKGGIVLARLLEKNGTGK